MFSQLLLLPTKYKWAIGGSIISILSIIAFYSILLSWHINCKNPTKLIIIPEGASLTHTANILVKENCLKLSEGKLFTFAMKVTFNEKNIFPGRYSFKGITQVGELVKLITSPSRDRIKVRLIEGWSIEQIADELHLKMDIDTYAFISLSKDDKFVHSIGISGETAEGYLFPDTYIFLQSYTEKDIIRVMVNQFFYNMKNYIDKANFDQKMNIHEITTLASIIQGEAVDKSEMPVISSVYHNRLHKGMMLQADPTIQYIIPGKNRRLWNKDLGIDNPYNTYKYNGLPPGPINNPGLNALHASIFPDSTEYLYFVADGLGKHLFSHTIEEHNKAKNELRRNRRKYRKKK